MFEIICISLDSFEMLASCGLRAKANQRFMHVGLIKFKLISFTFFHAISIADRLLNNVLLWSSDSHNFIMQLTKTDSRSTWTFWFILVTWTCCPCFLFLLIKFYFFSENFFLHWSVFTFFGDQKSKEFYFLFHCRFEDLKK